MQNKDINSQDNNNLNDAIYPLNFVLRYVSDKRDELAAMETECLKGLLELNETALQLYNYIKEHKNPDGSLSAHEVEMISALLNESDAKAHHITKCMTEKGMVFEDMNNILRQTRSITSDIIMHDELTLAYNRYFYFAYADELYKKAMNKNGLSMAFIDIDHFRDFNTNHGHDFGDKALRHFSNIVNGIISEYEETFLIRVGGDEFVILNSGTTCYEEFVSMLNRILDSISSTPIDYEGEKINITISIGAANAINSNTKTILELYKLTDDNVYEAKENGRNRIVA